MPDLVSLPEAIVQQAVGQMAKRKTHERRLSYDDDGDAT